MDNGIWVAEIVRYVRLVMLEGMLETVITITGVCTMVLDIILSCLEIGAH
jgi:hypothetical protein